MDNFTLMYFSPTGGTKHVAEVFRDMLGDHCKGQPWDLTSYFWGGELSEEDVAIFFFPVYGGRIPAPLYDRVAQISGRHTRAVLIAVYGNRAVDDALIEMDDLVSQHGFYVVAAGEVIAPHSLCPEVGEGRPDDSDRALIASFINDLLAAEGSVPIRVPGNRPYREYDGVNLHPTSGRACSLCMVCKEECPAEAIPAGDPGSVNKKKCISCMRCVHVCTAQVRSLPLLAKVSARKAVMKLCGEVRKEPKFYI